MINNITVDHSLSRTFVGDIRQAEFLLRKSNYIRNMSDKLINQRDQTTKHNIDIDQSEDI